MPKPAQYYRAIPKPTNGLGIAPPFMGFYNTHESKRLILLVIILMLASVSSGSIDKTYATGKPGGSLKACGSISISHSFIANIPATHDKNSGGGLQEDIEKTTVIRGFFGKLVRKLLQLFDGSLLFSSSLQVKYYFLVLCISGCSFLFCLFLIRFIHLADGSK